MALAHLVPANGAVSMPTGYGSGAIFGSMDIAEEQQAESVASYGAAVYDPWRGSGTPHSSITVAAFAQKGATSTSPFGAAGGLTDNDGASATFTLDTSLTYASNVLISAVRLMHARMRGAVPVTISMHNTGDPTVTWVTS